MNTTRHLLNIIFGFTLCLVLVVKVAPLFYVKAKTFKNSIPKIKELKHFSISYPFESDKYINLKLVANSKDTLEKRYYIPDAEHKKLVAFFKTKNNITNDNLKEILPLSFSKKQLDSFSNIQLTSNKKSIQILAINNIFLIGSKPNVFTKGLYYLLSVLFFITGITGLGLLTFVVIIFSKTGQLPNLPNKLKGIKHILKGSKTKKNQ